MEVPSYSPKNKIVVYTAIFGNYESLIEFPSNCREENVDYLCFTDDPNLKSKRYQIIYCRPYGNIPAFNNREIKILCHKFLAAYEYSIYIDGNVEIYSKVSPLLDQYLQTTDMAIFKHPNRSCIYNELTICLEKNKIPKNLIESSKTRITEYQQEEFPAKYGLTVNRCLLRRHSDSLKPILEAWWKEYQKIGRDQLCLMYVLWKYKYTINVIERSCRRNDIFKCHIGHRHHNKRKISSTLIQKS